MRSIISSAPQTLEQIDEPKWRENSACWAILAEADKATLKAGDEARPAPKVFGLWTPGSLALAMTLTRPFRQGGKESGTMSYPTGLTAKLPRLPRVQEPRDGRIVLHCLSRSLAYDSNKVKMERKI
jgi:hypothetical protein